MSAREDSPGGADRRGGRRRLRTLLATVVLVLAVAGTPDADAVSWGYLSICTDGGNGMAGAAVPYTVNRKPPTTVVGGTCSMPVRLATGGKLVTALPGAMAEVTQVRVRPANRLVRAANLGMRRVSVWLGAGTATSPTVVTFAGRPAAAGGSGWLDVCEEAAADSPSLVGAAVSFRIGDGPAIGLPAGPQGDPRCTHRGPWPPGTALTVTALPATGADLEGIRVSGDGSGSVDAPSVRVTLASGTTRVTFRHAAPAIPQTGFLSVCSDATDPLVAGAVDVTVDPPGAPATTRSVRVGQCTDDIEVPAGVVTVTQAPRPDTETDGITVAPAGRLVDRSTANRSVRITVPVSSDTSDSTTVTFVDAPLLGALQVCLTLSSRSGALAGTTVPFVVTSARGRSEVGVVAGAAGGTTCRVLQGALPVGTTATVSANRPEDTDLLDLAVRPAARGDVSGERASVVIGAGVTTVAAAIQALGHLSVCVHADDAASAAETFQYSVNGGAPFALRAGSCSRSLTVPAGAATVRQLDEESFVLARSWTVPADRWTNVVGTTVTVEAPYAGVSGETTVHLLDRVQTGRFRICGSSDEPSLQQVSFGVLWRYTVDGIPFTGLDRVPTGGCGPEHLDVPVVDADGGPVRVTTAEVLFPTTEVSGIVVAGAAGDPRTSPQTATATWLQLAGSAVVTYVNARTPLEDVGGVRV